MINLSNYEVERPGKTVLVGGKGGEREKKRS
jgi:hypothetical protein